MPVTIAPLDEACQALVSRINSGLTYTLPQDATYTLQIIDILEEVTGLRVDVCPETSEQLYDSLDPEDPSSHIIRVWVRAPLANELSATVAPFNLIAAKIWQRLNEHSTSRIQVWDCGKDRGENPGKVVLVKDNFYRAYCEMRVEVAPSP